MNRVIEEKHWVYKETNDYCVRIQEADGWILVHLDVYNWSPSMLKHLRQLFDKGLKEFADKGHELVFSSTLSEQTVKFCKLVKPVYEIREIDYYGTKYWVVAWETGLDI